jgi:hypothetical protein
LRQPEQENRAKKHMPYFANMSFHVTAGGLPEGTIDGDVVGLAAGEAVAKLVVNNSDTLPSAFLKP